MPVITVQMWSGRTKEQKSELVKAFTDAIVSIAKTTPEATTIIFADVDKENWAQSGMLSSDQR